MSDGRKADDIALALEEARSMFEQVAFPPGFVEFLTLPAYELL